MSSVEFFDDAGHSTLERSRQNLSHGRRALRILKRLLRDASQCPIDPSHAFVFHIG